MATKAKSKKKSARSKASAKKGSRRVVSVPAKPPKPPKSPSAATNTPSKLSSRARKVALEVGDDGKDDGDVKPDRNCRQQLAGSTLKRGSGDAGLALEERRRIKDLEKREKLQDKKIEKLEVQVAKLKTPASKPRRKSS